MTRTLVGSSYFDLPASYGLSEQETPSFEAELAHELCLNTTWLTSADALTAWANVAPLSRSRVGELIVRLPSSGYFVYYDPSELYAEHAPVTTVLVEALGAQAEGWSRTGAPATRHVLDEDSRGTPESKPRTDGLRARLTLLPRLLKEIIVNPFRDFTLVRRGDEVFVAEEGADLSDKDLSGVDLHQANLQGANLERTLLAKANLEGVNLRKANLTDAVLQGANLRKADLRYAILDNCDLRGADRWGAAVDPAALSRAILEYEPSDHGG